MVFGTPNQGSAEDSKFLLDTRSGYSIVTSVNCDDCNSQIYDFDASTTGEQYVYVSDGERVT